MKKLLSMLLATAVMLSVFTVVPVIAFAEASGDYTYDMLDDGTVEIRYYGGSGGDVAIPSAIDGYSVTKIGENAFYDCNSLTSVTIPDSVTTIGQSAFYYCRNMTSVTIPDSVTTILGPAFYGTKWYNDQPDGLVFAGKVAYRMKGNCPSVVVIKDGTTGIANGAFYDCSSLTSVTIPDSVKYIGDSAFQYCSGMTSVKIPDSVTAIGYRVFQYCSGMTSVTIPDSIKTIGDEAFSGCSGLTSVVIPDSVTTIGYAAFTDCSAMTSVTIGNSVTSIGRDAFCDCYSLTSVIIPDSVTTIGSDAFFYTEWYNNQPNGLVYAGKVAYKMKGDSPSEVVIQNGTSGIAGSAFYGCSGMTSVTIPASVTNIGDSAFYKCSHLTDVYFGGTKEDWEEIDIQPNNLKLTNATIHYSEPISSILGDADGDGEVTVIDVTTIQRILAGYVEEDYYPVASDTDKDNAVTIFDATAIQRYLASLSYPSGIGDPII